MRFLHISDTHYLVDYSNVNDMFNTTLNKMSNQLSNLEKLLSEENKNFDFIIHTGDITHHGDKNDYLELDKKLKNMFPNIPIFYTSGNHDNLEIFYDALNIENKKVNCYELNSVLIVELNSSDKYLKDGIINEESVEEVLHILNNNKDKEIVVFTHHHCLKEQFEMPSADIPSNFDKLFDHDNLIAFLTGHTHHSYSTNINNTLYQTVGSLSFVCELKNRMLEVQESTECIIYDNSKVNEKTKVLSKISDQLDLIILD